VRRPQPGSHTPRPARGELISCSNPASTRVREVWCHPDDTPRLLQGMTVNVVPCWVRVVDRLAYADQLQITEAACA